jgi:hypothetical protein
VTCKIIGNWPPVKKRFWALFLNSCLRSCKTNTLHGDFTHARPKKWFSAGGQISNYFASHSTFRQHVVVDVWWCMVNTFIQTVCMRVTLHMHTHIQMFLGFWVWVHTCWATEHLKLWLTCGGLCIYMHTGLRSTLSHELCHVAREFICMYACVYMHKHTHNDTHTCLKAPWRLKRCPRFYVHMCMHAWYVCMHFVTNLATFHSKYR